LQAGGVLDEGQKGFSVICVQSAKLDALVEMAMALPAQRGRGATLAIKLDVLAARRLLQVRGVFRILMVCTAGEIPDILDRAHP